MNHRSGRHEQPCLRPRARAALAAPPPRLVAGAALAVSLLTVCTSTHAQCTPQWLPMPSAQQGSALALDVFVEGFGPALFVGGHLISAGGHPVNKIARWDGRRWSPLGDGVGPNGIVYAVAGIDDAPGNPDLVGLYAGGTFQVAYGAPADCIARWYEKQWHEPGGGTSIYVLSLMPDRTQGLPGAAHGIFVGGPFQSAGGLPASGIARWDGNRWSDMGGGLRPAVAGQQAYPFDFEFFDDGTGPALYVGGTFRYAGNITAWNLARWDGQRWSTVGTSGVSTAVRALGVFDDGSGGSLYVGSEGFPGLRRWDGQQWHTIPGWDSGSPRAMLVHDDGTGPELYVAGAMTINGALAHVASWNGARWRLMPELSGLGSGTHAVDLAVFQDDPTGRIPPALYVGGYFWYAGGIEAIGLARWGCPHPTLGCYGDCDLNGTLDFFDFLCFQNAFLAQDPYADCDRDGILSFFDLLCFQNAFLAGCP
jgi:trimeric autotransporter adhesin